MAIISWSNSIQSTSGASGPSVISKQLSNKACATSSANNNGSILGFGCCTSGTHTTPTINSFTAPGSNRKGPEA